MTSYQGSELELFAGANNWKRYWGNRLRTFTVGRVLDVGAGIGSTLRVLGHEGIDHWTALEPDRELAGQIDRADLPFDVDVVAGALDSVTDQTYNTILYIDVLEHIENDQAELRSAAGLLEPGGCLIVLAPAHQSLYSPFDKAVGHFRRYDRASLLACAPAGLQLVKLEFLDSAGMLLSAANRLLLRQSLPTPGQIRFWDRVIVPISTLVDPLTGRRLGKTAIAVWQRQSAPI